MSAGQGQNTPTMMVFVSHSHEDDAFCRAVVEGLHGAGANVWYDEHNMGSGQLMDTIERELRARPVFVLVLSPAALRSQWVRDESKWAYARYKREPTRIILPVLAATVPDEDDIWMFMQDFKRIESPGLRPYPTGEAVRRMLHALALTPKGEPQAIEATAGPLPTESADDLLARGKALMAQKKYAEALPLLKRATELDPRSFDAWGNLGFVAGEVGRWQESLDACEKALALDATQAWVWNNKGNALRNLKRDDEALVAFDRALAIDPNYAFAWNNKADLYNASGRYQDAMMTIEHALKIDAGFAIAWGTKGRALEGLRRYEEALATYDRAVTLRPAYPYALNGKARVLRALGRSADAEEAERRAKELGG